LLLISTSRTRGGVAPRVLKLRGGHADRHRLAEGYRCRDRSEAACAGLAPARQLSGRSGQSIQQPECRSNSAGMRKPSRAGNDVSVRNAGLRARMLALPLYLEEASHVRSQARHHPESPPGARRSPSRTASCAYPISRSSPSSKATAPAGHLACERARVRRRRAESVRHEAQDPLDGSVCGEKANKAYNSWLPDETVTACRDYLVSIKGPLTTPVGGGIRSLNVALRQLLDLYVCLRPVRWFKGVPSPVLSPEKVDMVIFRENTEDIYAGIEFEAGSADVKKFLDLFKQSFPKQYAKIRFPETSGIGFKPASKEGTERLFRAAVEYAIANKRKSVTIVHKGNIMKFTEGAFRNWSYQLAEREFAIDVYTWEQWERTNRRTARRKRIGDGHCREARARSSSRTPSPTSPCSRCSLVPTSSTWSQP
jgi:hypothetical protein